ncbi:glycosyltransferase-like domain-containing protein 1 [Thalassophryne amazonica]|uniref:glycosyltransferase-like domain-containing protein 1 n=1 Tax=Thalassophryne amazonica TaxID=390379 RepID=UPI001471C633|nr:glycosyltransferase-like domain-containing protein 1 [Thalassophryne amazonica]
MLEESPHIVLLEAFYGGSHKQLIDLLKSHVPGCTAFTLPAKKWHWKARTGALYFMQTVPVCPSYRVLFTSSVLNLCELVALRPDLALLKKVLYFHENQLIYPVQKDQERDFQYGYNQVLSCLVADVVLFNSRFNMDSFLSSIKTFMKKIPDHRPKDLDQLIRPKCQVLHYPIQFPEVTRLLPKHKLLRRAAGLSPGEDISASGTQHQLCITRSEDLHSGGDEDVVPGQTFLEADPRSSEEPTTGPRVKALHIVWPHRWEHDKNPELFFSTLLTLKDRGLDFDLSVLGQTYSDTPDIFAEARRRLGGRVLHWGFLPTKDEYFRVLCQADVVVSTTRHEFFGVAVLEAVHCGCFPLCPKSLVYPELFPDEYLYATPEQLLKKLQGLCRRPHLARTHTVQVNTAAFSWAALKDRFQSLLAHSVPEHATAAASTAGTLTSLH